jgi:hypothetical protein
MDGEPVDDSVGQSLGAQRVRHRVREGRHAYHSGRDGGRRGHQYALATVARPTVPIACPRGPAGHEAPPRDSGRMDAGGGFGGLVLPAGAYVVKGGQVPLGTRGGHDDRRPGLAEPGAGARPHMDPVAAVPRPAMTLCLPRRNAWHRAKHSYKWHSARH